MYRSLPTVKATRAVKNSRNLRIFILNRFSYRVPPLFAHSMQPLKVLMPAAHAASLRIAEILTFLLTSVLQLFSLFSPLSVASLHSNERDEAPRVKRVIHARTTC